MMLSGPLCDNMDINRSSQLLLVPLSLLYSVPFHKKPKSHSSLLLSTYLTS